jgi:general secretion pathway protein A
MLEEFEIAKPAESHAQRLVTLQNFLLERYRAGQGTVLIIDEAQNLYPQTLEQIRLLSNFETTKEKNLQIILVGQPELQARLELPELRQLNQRISLRCSIPRLSKAATRNYIRTRLRMAGAADTGMFTEAAITQIADYASGIPRIVNTLCDHSLVIAYADQTRRVDRAIVDEAIAYVEAGARPRARRRARTHARVRRPGGAVLRWALIGIGFGVLAGGGAATAVGWPAVSDALRSTAAYVSDLAHSARSLVGL